MSLDSEDRRSDFAKWAEEMSYEEEKEYKKQKKLELKKEKKAKKNKGEQNSLADVPVEEPEEVPAEAADEPEETKNHEKTQNALKDSASKDDKSEDNASEDTVSEDTASEDEDSDDIDDYNPDYVKKKKNKKKKPDEVNVVKELLGLIIYIGIVIILCYCIVTFVGQRTQVHGHSMSHTLEDGDNLWIDKISYRFSDPKRFDIVVFPYQNSDTYYIKRVIGLPGETVQIMPDGSIYINGELLNESYGREVINDSGVAGEPILLGEDEYFVLGDNRNDSRDSRFSDVGNIKKEIIVGKAVLRLTPFSKFGKVK